MFHLHSLWIFDGRNQVRQTWHLWDMLTESQLLALPELNVLREAGLFLWHLQDTKPHHTFKKNSSFLTIVTVKCSFCGCLCVGVRMCERRVIPRIPSCSSSSSITNRRLYLSIRSPPLSPPSLRKNEPSPTALKTTAFTSRWHLFLADNIKICMHICMYSTQKHK